MSIITHELNHNFPSEFKKAAGPVIIGLQLLRMDLSWI